MTQHQNLLQGVAPGQISFIYGHPDPTLYPLADLRSLLAQVLDAEHGPFALGYGPEQGHRPLIDYLRQKFLHDEGLVVEQENLLLTLGSTYAVNLITCLYTRPDDVVFVEAPTYHDAIAVFRDYPLQLRQIPVDDEGLRVDALARALEDTLYKGQRPALLYTVPNFQNPSGVTLSEERRRRLLSLVRGYDMYIIEDDVYRDLCYEGDVPPSLYALAGGDPVLRVGSFSKILGPGLRLGWVMAAPRHIERLTRSGVMRMAGGANPLTAHLVAAYCQQGLLEPHIAELVAAYRARRDVMLAALEAHMPEGVRWTRPRGGFFVWVTLPEGLSAREVLARTWQQGVAFVPGDEFFATGGGTNHLRLAFSFVPPADIERGIQVLGEAIRSLIG